MDDNKKIFQSGGTEAPEPKIESASNANYLDGLYKDMGLMSFDKGDNSAISKFTNKGADVLNYNFPDINEKNPLSSYTEYGVNVGAGKNYNLERAQNQTGTDNFLNFAANILPKVGFGMVGIAGHLGGLIFDQDGDYENALTTWAKESEEYFTSDSKNYAENPNASFFSGEYWTDAANVFDVIDGVATSALTFVIPGAGAAFTANKIALGLSKILNASAAAKKVGMAMATGASSLTMGYAEAAMSGADIYKEQLEKNLAKGMQYDDAKRIATGAAQTTVRMATIFNTALNIPILGSFTQKTDDILRKEVGDIVDDLNLRTVDNKGNVVDAVTGKPIDQVKLADQAKDLGGVKQMPDAIKNLPKIDEVKDLKAATERLKNIELKPSTWKDVAKVYGKEAGLEFLEEGQIALAEEAGRKYTDPNNTGQNFIKSLKDAFSGVSKEAFWESAALGALGGVGMKGFMDVIPVNREVSEIDPNITFDAATQTYKTPEGKEVRDNLKRNPDGTLIKKRMRASSHDREQKKAMIASEVAYMVEDLSTTQYWQEKMQTIANDFKAGNKVVDVTLPDGKLDKRVMTKGEAAIKIQEAKDQLFNISARRSIMSGKGDNFKLVFQNIANTANDKASKDIIEKEANEEIANLKDIVSKNEAIKEDANASVEVKAQADEVIKQAKKAMSEASARIGMTHAQLQGFSSGDNDNEYKKDALEAIAKIDAYTKEYNQLKDTYDYGTAESRQALGKLLENLMKRHTYEYALKDRAKKFASLFENSTDVTEEDKNNYIARFKDLTHNAKLEIYHLRKKLEAIADEEYLNGGTQTATEFLKELNEYRANQINNDLQEIKNDPSKLAKYEEHRENHIAKLNKIKEELEGKKKPLVDDLPIAEQQLQAQTDDVAKTKIEESINKAKLEIENLDKALISLDADIKYFENIDNFILATLIQERHKKYKEKFVSDKLKALEDKQKQYEDSENRVNAIIEKLKNTKKEDIVEFNNLKNQLLNELKNSKFGFVTLADLGLDPKQINGDSYERLAELISYQQMDFSLALAEALKSPEHEKLNIETLLKLEELDKDFKEMTSRGGHDKLVANAYELHKRQTKLFLDYQNESKSINENGGANISTPVVSTPATNTQPTQAPERKNKYGIIESKYLEYVNLEQNLNALEGSKTSYLSKISEFKDVIEEQEIELKSINKTLDKFITKTGNLIDYFVSPIRNFFGNYENGQDITDEEFYREQLEKNKEILNSLENKLKEIEKQILETQAEIKAILKDSPFEAINTKAEGLKNEVTSNRDKDITNSRKEDISINPDRWAKRQKVWHELFAAYDTYLKAIDDYKNDSLENISTFGDALYNSRLNDLEQALSNAKNEFETAKRNSEKEFLRIEREIKLAENPNLFKDYQATNYAGKLTDLREQLNNLDLSSPTYQRDRMILENEIGLYENLNQASLDYQEALADSLVSGASQQDLADKYKEYVVALEKLRKESNSEITRKATALQEQIDIIDKESDRLLDIINKGFTDVETKAGVKKAIENLYKLYNDKLKALRSNSLFLIPNIDSAIIEAQQELDEAVEREILAEEEIEIEKEKQKQIDVLKNRINTQKQKLDEYGKLYSKNSGTTKKLIARLQNELNDILSNISNVSINDTKQLLDDIDTQTKAVVNSIYGTPMLKYLNNGGKSVFGNSDEVVAFLEELGLDSKNVSPLLSGAFENGIGLTITLTYDDESPIRGEYDSVKNRIELNAAYLQTPEQAREVLMHELVHALTRQRFQDPKSGIVGKTIAVLDKWLSVLGISTKDDNGNDISTKEKLEQIRDNVLMNNLPINDNLKNIFTRIIDAIDKNGTVDETRLDELYAEAFSNKEFAELLKSQTIEGSYKPEGNYKVKGKTIRVKTSIWKKFMSVVLDGVANIITRVISDKPRQISILNELALILNDNPVFIETPEETTSKLAEEKVLGDEKIVEPKPTSPVAMVNAPIQPPIVLPNPQTSSDVEQQEPILSDDEAIDTQISEISEFIDFLTKIEEDVPKAIIKTQEQAKKDGLDVPKEPNRFYKYLLYRNDFDNKIYYLENNDKREGVAYDNEGNKYTFVHTTQYEDYYLGGANLNKQRIQTGTLIIKDKNGKTISKGTTNWENQFIKPHSYRDVKAIKEIDKPNALQKIELLEKQKSASSSQEFTNNIAPEQKSDKAQEEELIVNDDINQQIKEKEEKLKILKDGLVKLKDYGKFWYRNANQDKNWYDHVIFTHGEKTFYLTDENIITARLGDAYEEVINRSRGGHVKRGIAYDEKGNSYIFIYEPNTFSTYNRDIPEIGIYEYEKVEGHWSSKEDKRLPDVYFIKNTVLDITIDNAEISNTWQFKKGISKTNFKSFSDKDKKQAKEKTDRAYEREAEVKEEIKEIEKEIEDLKNPKQSQSTPTIDLTKQTFVAVPVLDAPVDTSTKTSPNLASNIVENDLVKINTDNPFEPKQSILETFSANATPPEEEKVYPYIIDFTDEEFRDVETIFNDVEAERKKLDIVAESDALLLEIEEEKNALLLEIENNPESREVFITASPSGAPVQLSFFTDKAQEEADLIKQNANKAQQQAEEEKQKAIDKVEKEKKKRNSKPKTPKQVSPNEVKNQSQEPANLPESGTIKADNDLGIPEDMPVIIQPNGDGSNTILPAENNRISELPQPIAGAEPISTNAPNSSVLRNIEPSNTKAPERKDNAATASKEPVIDKRGIPIRGSQLEKDLVAKNENEPIIANKFAITQEPDGKQAIRRVNNDGSLGKKPMLPLFDKGTYDKDLTEDKENQSRFGLSEKTKTSPLELVRPAAEHTSYTPTLSENLDEFNKWYDNLIAEKEQGNITSVNDIDFTGTPIEDSYYSSNQKSILKTLMNDKITDESLRKDIIKAQYVAANEKLANAFNEDYGSKDNSKLGNLSVDIIKDDSKVIRVEEADSLEGKGWNKVEENDTFVQVFDTLEDFLGSTNFLAFGQGKINAIYEADDEITVIAMTNPLVENNSVRVVLVDNSNIISGNFQNPNRFTKATFVKKDGKLEVTLSFLNTNDKFAEAFKDDTLFDKSELSDDQSMLEIEIEVYIESNAAARRLMSNFVKGLENSGREAMQLETPEEKSNYLSYAEVSFTLRQPTQFADKSIFAKNGDKILFYESQKGSTVKTYGFVDVEGDNTFANLESKLKEQGLNGKFVFVKLQDTYLPVKVKAKAVIGLSSNDDAFKRLMFNLDKALASDDIKTINSNLNLFFRNNIYIAHKQGDQKLNLNYYYDAKEKQLIMMVGEGSSLFTIKHDKVKLQDLNSKIKANLFDDLKQVVTHLKDTYHDEAFNDKSIILSPGDFGNSDSFLSYFNIPFDPIKPFERVSFSYVGNDYFETPPVQIPTENETFTESPIVNKDIMTQTPEQEMIPYAVKSSSLDSDNRLTEEGFQEELEVFKEELEELGLDGFKAKDLEPIIPDIESKYPTMFDYGFKKKSLKSAFFNNTIHYKDDNAKHLSSTVQQDLRELLTEINDLVKTLKSKNIEIDDNGDVKVKQSDISDAVDDSTCYE